MNRKPSPTKSNTPVYLVKIIDCSKDDVLNANKIGHVQEAYEMDCCRMFTSLYNEVCTLMNIPNDVGILVLLELKWIVCELSSTTAADLSLIISVTNKVTNKVTTKIG
jgi:hypothetical protein